MQSGFQFDNQTLPHFAQAKGTWLQPQFTREEYFSLFDIAQNILADKKDIAGKLFKYALSECIANHDAQISQVNPQGIYQLWGLRLDDVSKTDLMLFYYHCVAMQNVKGSGAEYKVVNDLKHVEVGMHIPGLGSLKAYFKKSGEWQNLTYTITRSTFFLDSYHDDIESIYAPYRVWESAYCAQVLAESGNKYASVKTFSIGGKRFVNKGTSSSKNWHECTAYSLLPLDLWKGDTFTYSTIIRAYDEGCLQRGDSRGLVVRVKGELCVLDRFYRVYDDKVCADDYKYLPCMDDPDDAPDDELDDELADHLELEEV